MSALRTGYTTGSCAAAAAKAAVLLLAEGRAGGERGDPPSRRGEDRASARRMSGGRPSGAEAAVRKDAGDDPDVTNGALILASVAWTEGDGSGIRRGRGGGNGDEAGPRHPPRRAGDQPRAAADDPEAVREVTPRGVRVTIAIPGGAELAAKDLQPAARHRRGALDPRDHGDRPPLQLLGDARVAPVRARRRRGGGRPGAGLRPRPHRRAGGAGAFPRRGRSRSSRWETSGASPSTRRFGAPSRRC